MPEYESSSVNDSDKRPWKQRRAVFWNEHQKRMAYKKHPCIDCTVLLLYLSVMTALPSRCVFFDISVHSIDCARACLDIASVGITEHRAPIVKSPHRGTSLCAVDGLSCLAVGWDRPRFYLRIFSPRDL